MPRFWTNIVTLSALAGLLPFLAGLLITFAPGLSPLDPVIFERALIGYGAMILAFLGGVRWGLRLQQGSGPDLPFIFGILGSIVGFFTLLMPYGLALFVLVIGFAMQGAWDIFSSAVPGFYARLRALMTTLVCLILIGILIAGTVV